MSHETLWAPWRLDYIKDPQRQAAPRPDTACFLCRYRDTQADDAENFVVLRAKSVFVVLNRFPYNNGHLLIAPLAHKAGLEELDPEELRGLIEQIRDMTGLLQRTINAEGFNVGLNLGRVAGAGLPGHLHWHVVPRWNGDSNFMTVVADTNVIPQSLRALHDLLRQSLGDQSAAGASTPRSSSGST